MTRATGIGPIRRACAYLEERAGERVTLAELGRVVGMSPFHLQRRFVAEVGVSPAEYVRALRTDALKERLRAGDAVSRATFEAGFGSSSRVYERASEALGMTPATYRKGGRGARIAFATRRTAVGDLLIAATESGVCSVQLGDSREVLEASLRREFPLAEIGAAAPEHPVNEWLDRVAAMIGGRPLDGSGGAVSGSGSEDVPLDIDGTEFQWRVWRALRSIPAGERRSYTEVAREIGSPRSVRAVARACASNRAALVIPCHRVVREDGSLGGYRWGMERKRRLLEGELASVV
jgi:AraC family transcriptional regulator, regulatory protein of adaptative response / methylated-DNA-[protein]-cysteine methyltransferase